MGLESPHTLVLSNRSYRLIGSHAGLEHSRLDLSDRPIAKGSTAAPGALVLIPQPENACRWKTPRGEPY
ncbi:hypothetical protein MES5069_700024 [Mesorhizobium escarrei]|uniref:Uncharacterized protein n=1 Tax=Mesorhizobium escarrei TaxID=666018 RepID=A0ABM9EHF1_9HYPH|nr:hypothetical protein MES5069_700024 [Mesorhizobium escarrei]